MGIHESILSLYHTLFTASTQQSTSVTLVHSFQPHNHYCFETAPCYYSFLTTQRPGLDESSKELTTNPNHHVLQGYRSCCRSGNRRRQRHSLCWPQPPAPAPPSPRSPACRPRHHPGGS